MFGVCAAYVHYKCQMMFYRRPYFTPELKKPHGESVLGFNITAAALD